MRRTDHFKAVNEVLSEKIVVLDGCLHWKMRCSSRNKKMASLP